MYPSTGILRYHNDFKLIVEVDPSIGNLYRSLIPKYIDFNRPKYNSHITVVRSGLEDPPRKEFWGKYEGEEIDFVYDSAIKEGSVYFWLNVYCVRLEEIRVELGLSATSEYTLPPEGFKKVFHCTLANKKPHPHIQQEF